MVIEPLTVKLASVPTLVTLVWLDVVSVPAILVPDKLPPVTFPVADIKPEVSKLPPVMLPVAVITPAVDTLPPVTLPVAVSEPAATAPE